MIFSIRFVRTRLRAVAIRRSTKHQAAIASMGRSAYLPRRLLLIDRREIRVVVDQPDQPSRITDPPVDVRPAERHRSLRATIHDDFAALEPNCVGEVTAGQRDGVFWNRLIPREAKCQRYAAPPRAPREYFPPVCSIDEVG